MCQLSKMVAHQSLWPGQSNQRCRVILLPRFSETGTLALVNTKTLEVKTVSVEVGSTQNGSQ